MKRSFLLIFILVIFQAINAKAQVVFLKSYPKLKVDIALTNKIFTHVDSVKVQISLTNKADTTQKVLFDKPNTRYPWGTSAFIMDSRGKRIDAINSRATVSAAAFSEKQAEQYMYYLQSGKTLTGSYYLTGLMIFTEPTMIKPGKYYLYIIKDGNKSNRVSFTLK
jgi:hypothetical protein